MPRSLWRLPQIALRERRHKAGRARIPEPMAMDGPESVEQFHIGGGTIGAMQAVYDLNARALNVLVPEGGRLLDLGVGPGRALHHFLSLRPDVTATAVDLAPNMLATARRFLDDRGVGPRVSLVEADITTLPEEMTAARWDAVSCVWTLHHLPDRGHLRAALRQMAEIVLRTRARSGCSTSSACGARRRCGRLSPWSSPTCRPSSWRTGWRARRRPSRSASFVPSSRQPASPISRRATPDRSHGSRLGGATDGVAAAPKRRHAPPSPCGDQHERRRRSSESVSRDFRAEPLGARLSMDSTLKALLVIDLSARACQLRARGRGPPSVDGNPPPGEPSVMPWKARAIVILKPNGTTVRGAADALRVPGTARRPGRSGACPRCALPKFELQSRACRYRYDAGGMGAEG